MKEKVKNYQKETNKQIELLVNNINKYVVILSNKNNNNKDCKPNLKKSINQKKNNIILNQINQRKKRFIKENDII